MQLGKKYNVKLLSRLFAGFLILGEISISQIPKCFITLFNRRDELFDALNTWDPFSATNFATAASF